jgi:hypothetical protein
MRHGYGIRFNSGACLAGAGRRDHRFVKTVSGSAAVVDAGKAVPAKVGTPIKMGNTLQTGRTGASLGVTFKDNTVMSFRTGYGIDRGRIFLRAGSE